MNQQQEIQRLLRRLVSFQTTNGATKEITACFEFIDRELSFYPFQKKTIVHNGVESRIWSTEETLTPRIALNAHIDVVPASLGMFTMQTMGENYVGRGVSDMKFAVVCFILALKKIVESKGTLPSLSIILTSDEEVGGPNGVGHLVRDLGYRPEVVIIPDGGDNWFLVEEAKGVLQVKLESKGVSAHASTPWNGKNAAIPLLQDVAKAVELFPELTTNEWVTTMNLGQIHCGLQTNQVPDKGTAFLDVRHIAHDKRETLKQRFISTCTSCDVTFPIEGDAFVVNTNDRSIEIWKNLIKAYRSEPFKKEAGASDGRYFSAVGSSVILCKPNGGDIHTEKEWIKASSIADYTKVLEQFIRVYFCSDTLR